MSRGPYAKVAARNGALLERIRELKADHPFWGYRRVWAYLRYIDGLTVNQKRVYGVMKANDLLVKPNPKLRARLQAAAARCAADGQDSARDTVFADPPAASSPASADGPAASAPAHSARRPPKGPAGSDHEASGLVQLGSTGAASMRRALRSLKPALAAATNCVSPWRLCSMYRLTCRSVMCVPGIQPPPRDREGRLPAPPLTGHRVCRQAATVTDVTQMMPFQDVGQTGGRTHAFSRDKAPNIRGSCQLVEQRPGVRQVSIQPFFCRSLTALTQQRTIRLCDDQKTSRCSSLSAAISSTCTRVVSGSRMWARKERTQPLRRRR